MGFRRPGEMAINEHQAPEALQRRRQGLGGQVRAAVFDRLTGVREAQSRVLEDTLVRREIGYQVIGGTKFYDRREIKDALAYLRALVNPDDEVSWKRIVNTPRRGVGDTSVAKVESYAQGAGLTFRDALRAADAHMAEMPPVDLRLLAGQAAQT